MESRIRKKLIQLARTEGGPIAYQRLINEVDLGLNMDIPHEKSMLGEILDDISRREFEAERPLLSSLIRGKAKGQGDNFFKLCEELGLGEASELKKDKEFPQVHREKCYNFWQDEKNYEKYLEVSLV